MPAEPLDDLDLRILDAMQLDATLSTPELAEKVGLSQSPCWRRLNRLKEAGYILGQVSLLDAERLGFDMLCFAQVRLSAHGRANLEQFSDAIRRMHEVTECYAMTGAFDFLLKIVSRDIKAYERFVFSKLSILDSVQEIQTSIVLSQVKSTTRLPLRFS